MRNKVLVLILPAIIASPAGADPVQVNYHRDIAPILARHCVHCHRAGEAAPMPLGTYQQVRPWAKAIREAVATRRMPPWLADGGHFANARVLSPEHILSIKNWVDSGSPEGNRKHSAQAPSFTEGWTIGQPDFIAQLPGEVNVQATGQMEYVHYIVPTGFTEDRWVRDIEVRAGNRAVVHHIGVFLRPKGSQWLSEAKPGEAFARKNRLSGRSPTDELLAQYVTGGQPQTLPEGAARLIPAGSDLVFQVHYQPNGKPATDRSYAGFVFAKQEPAQRVHTIGVADTRFVIPPGAAAISVNAAWRLNASVRLLSVTPHMHLRGKSFACDLTQLDGSVGSLVKIPQWNRNWQLTYEFAQPIEAPQGSRITCTAVYDNSANNPVNPDPKAEVRWGDQTTDEMMVSYLDVAFPASRPVGALYRR